jgi:ATP-binding cassette subfamily G (WHITE) protein 2|mmetsp:Transcript_67204/g.105010  ORF Transcript_67204/g.105010 Transcript_67204/m.105010 type:complete len:646 (-) Transcript_67204:271-2208(-)
MAAQFEDNECLRQPLSTSAGDTGATITSEVHPVLLSWKDVNYTVKVKKNRQLEDKRVLQNVSGHAEPGSFTAILGASGSGKTSLLSVLADRLLTSKGATLKGSLQVNGQNVPSDYRSSCAFVQQTEVFYPYGTVGETVEMSARLRLGNSMDKAAKKQRAIDVIQKLGLTKTLNSKVGNGASVKGISGGEMKRVAIACELVSTPSLVMLDEPTSGLDSSAALNVVESLTELAKAGHTVVASIHQPGSAIYALFDRVIVLAEGRLAYFGHASGVVEHFSKLGYQCPQLFNPAEYVIQVTALDFSSNEAEEQSRTRLAPILDVGNGTVGLPRQVSTGYTQPPPISTSCFEQFSLLYRRTLRDAVRNKFALILKVVQGLITTVIMVGLYSDLDSGNVIDVISINIRALLFFITINGLFGPLFGTINAFAPEVQIVLRERMNNLYAMAPYYLAKVLVAVPLEILPLVVGNTVAYWWLKLDHQFDKYCIFLLFTCACTLSSVGIGFLLASATGGNVQAASAAVGPIALIFLLLGGFFINTSTIPVWISWLANIDYIQWAYEGQAINQLLHAHISIPGGLQHGSCSASSFCDDGVEQLNKIFNNGNPKSEDEWEAIMWRKFAFICIAIGVYNFLGYLVLLAKGPKYLRIENA